MHSVRPSTLSLEEVVTGGFCVGCGGCAVSSDGAIPMGRDRTQVFQPQLTDESATNSAVCPFSGVGPDESAIAGQLYEDNG